MTMGFKPEVVAFWMDGEPIADDDPLAHIKRRAHAHVAAAEVLAEVARSGGGWGVVVGPWGGDPLRRFEEERSRGFGEPSGEIQGRRPAGVRVAGNKGGLAGVGERRGSARRSSSQDAELDQLDAETT